jgi:hypothetical protein
MARLLRAAEALVANVLTEADAERSDKQAPEQEWKGPAVVPPPRGEEDVIVIDDDSPPASLLSQPEPTRSDQFKSSQRRHSSDHDSTDDEATLPGRAKRKVLSVLRLARLIQRSVEV